MVRSPPCQQGERTLPSPVIPAKAGIHFFGFSESWIPVFT
jgi:hypothetical protein